MLFIDIRLCGGSGSLKLSFLCIKNILQFYRSWHRVTNDLANILPA